jgi:hypothetical protein
MSGRGRGKPGGCGSHGFQSQESKSSQEADKPATVWKTLADYIYYVGSVKQASDFSVITDYLINHIFQKFEYNNDIADTLESCQACDFSKMMPRLLQSSATVVNDKQREDQQFLILYEAEIKRFVDQKATYEANLEKAFTLLWAQCNKSLQNKLPSRTNYDLTIKG